MSDNTPKYTSFKTYGHERGLSCAWRNMKLHPSHCAKIHGYALGFKLGFSATSLEKGIVVDFGSLKSFYGMLEDTFDHKLIVAVDDPNMDLFENMHKEGLCDLVILPAVGCEAFAYYAFGALETWLRSNGYTPRVKVDFVECWEHGANGARYEEGK